MLKGACQEIGRTKIFSDDQKRMLTTVFQKRFEQALGLVESGRVRKYHFTPSGRTIWVVRGRGRDYQVLPDGLFCTCDDYYFRVMEHKKQLCYHIIAQQLSEAMSKHNAIEMVDSRYPEISSKLTTIAARE
jgi:predicted nucleic acid-binding Zn finger protein